VLGAREAEIVVVGAGLAGLAAGVELGSRAIVLERASRPGGLVRTERFGAYWFDHVLHLLYCPDAATQQRVETLVGSDLASCPPEAWVETPEAVVRYPFQMHLGGLPHSTVAACLRDLAAVTFGPKAGPPADFAELLRSTFGQAMCEAFLFPFNRKLWKRPLESLAPSGFQWTITHPDFARVVDGALQDGSGATTHQAYNAHGYYPRPASGAALRGMEVVAAALARRVPDLRLNHIVEAIDLDARSVTVTHSGERTEFRYRTHLALTLPLPQALALCRQTPPDLREAARHLTRNRVLTVAFSIEGPRPDNRGHWRYYSDESLIFTRLIYMHMFDPATAPPDGWGVMAEVTQRAEDPVPSAEAIIARCQQDLVRAGALPDDCRIIDARLLEIDPAYVVFTTASQDVVARGLAFFRSHGVEPLGRYGRWEYSSMGQVMRDGFTWAASVCSQS
jgi:protoporphyrinogen oxidase